MKTSELLSEILPALATVKQAMGSVAKNSSNPFFKSKYADLNAHLDAIEPLLQENGLILMQPVSNLETGGNLVESTIYHVASSQFISSAMKLVGESDMQKIGSAVTYARRYTLGSLLSMKAEDDDGEGSLNRNAKSTTKAKTSSKSTAGASFNKNKAKAAAVPTPMVESSNGDDL